MHAALRATDWPQAVKVYSYSTYYYATKCDSSIIVLKQSVCGSLLSLLGGDSHTVSEEKRRIEKMGHIVWRQRSAMSLFADGIFFTFA